MAHIPTLLDKLTKNWNQEQRQEIENILKELDIDDDDYYVFGLVAFGYYKDLYEKIPSEIAAESKKLLLDHEQVMAAAVQASQLKIAEIREETIANLVKTADQISGHKSLTQILMISIMAILLFFGSIGITYWLADKAARQKYSDKLGKLSILDDERIRSLQMINEFYAGTSNKDVKYPCIQMSTQQFKNSRNKIFNSCLIAIDP